MGKSPKMAEKAKKEVEQIPISTIKPENVKEILERGYDEAVNRVIEELKSEKADLQDKINDAINKGNWKKAQKLIDSDIPYLMVSVNPAGTKATVSIVDFAGIKKILKEGKKHFVDGVNKVLEGNLAAEFVKKYKSWDFKIGEHPTDLTISLTEMFTKHINDVMGISPPKGVKPGTPAQKIPEAKKVEFAKATVPKGKLPVYAKPDETTVTLYWPAWIKEKEKKFAEVVPEKVEKESSS